jgi:NAD(P)H-dependent flavin oxidoreductase YrpB (nitropropane dioxygenase family)
VIRTRLTDLLGIACPVVQAGMGYVSGARLAAGGEYKIYKNTLH